MRFPPFLRIFSSAFSFICFSKGTVQCRLTGYFPNNQTAQHGVCEPKAHGNELRQRMAAVGDVRGELDERGHEIGDERSSLPLSSLSV